MSKDTVTIIDDNSTGKEVELPLLHSDRGSQGDRYQRKLYKQLGYFTYDPGFMSTASCSSSGLPFLMVTKGVLQYRGYPIDQLAELSSLPGSLFSFAE